MRAVAIEQFGGPEQLVLTDEPEPAPGEGELLIDVRATALNRPDLLQRRGLYPPPPGVTNILGLECSGVVRAAGPGASPDRVGERVMALLPGGGYAERVAVHEHMALTIPESLSFEQGAAIPEAFLTAAAALFERAALACGETVLIHAAAGGVGSAAVELAVVHGANVVATASSDEKLSKVRELGAQTLVNYKEEDFVAAVMRASGGRGADVVLDFVGAKYAERHAECLAHRGRQVVLGLLGGSKASVDLSRLLGKRQSLLGLIMRSRPLNEKVELSRRFARDQLPLFADGRLRPLIDSVFPLDQVRKAHERMEANLNVGKIVLAVS